MFCSTGRCCDHLISFDFQLIIGLVKKKESMPFGIPWKRPVFPKRWGHFSPWKLSAGTTDRRKGNVLMSGIIAGLSGVAIGLGASTWPKKITSFFDICWGTTMVSQQKLTYSIIHQHVVTSIFLLVSFCKHQTIFWFSFINYTVIIQNKSCGVEDS